MGYTEIQQPTQEQTSVSSKVDKSKSWAVIKELPVYSEQGVNTMRKSGNEHFGNPFTDTPSVARKNPNLILMSSTEEAVQAYKDWLLGSPIHKILENVLAEIKEVADENPTKELFDKMKKMGQLISDFEFNQGKVAPVIEKQRQWILNQINQGKLDNTTLLYMNDRTGYKSHADALLEVVKDIRTNLAQEQTWDTLDVQDMGTESTVEIIEQEIISITPEELKKQVDNLVKEAKLKLKGLFLVPDNYIIGFHGGRRFNKPDKNQQYTGEFRNADTRRIAESAGARYEGQMLFYTEVKEEEEPFTYEQAARAALSYAIKYGDDTPTLYAYLIPEKYADFTNRGLAEVGVSYDNLEKGFSDNSIEEIGRVTFDRKIVKTSKVEIIKTAWLNYSERIQEARRAANLELTTFEQFKATAEKMIADKTKGLEFFQNKLKECNS